MEMICPGRKVVYGEKLSREEGCPGERLFWEKGALLIVLIVTVPEGGEGLWQRGQGVRMVGTAQWAWTDK